MNNILKSECAGPELLPSSSQFFFAGADPFSAPEEQQSHQALNTQVKQLPCSACPGPTPIAAWQQAQSQAVSGLRSQQEHEVLAQLRAQQAQLLQLTAVVSQAAAGGFHANINSSPSQKLFSLPSELHRFGVNSIEASHLPAGRPGELSPVAEQPTSSPGAATDGAAGHADRRMQLLKTQSLQHAQLSSTGTQLAGLWFPGIIGSATDDLHTRSAPSSPKHGTVNFVNRSLSLQKTPEQASGPLQQANAVPVHVHLEVLQSQDYQELSPNRSSALHDVTASPAAAHSTWESGMPAAGSHTMQQQQLVSGAVDSSSMLASRDLSRQLGSRPSSIKDSSTNQTQQLLQAEVARLHDDQRDVHERLLASQQQLTCCQELVLAQQQQLLAARAELAAADKARTHLQEQLQHLEAKVAATESQLEFAHRQLDVRQQQLRGQADATSAAQRSGEQLATEVEALKEELLASRRELDAVNKRLTLEAFEARRAVDEVSSLCRDLAAVQTDASQARQATADVRERARQEAAEADRRAAQMNGQLADLGQQIVLLKERGSAMQTANDRLHDQLASAEGDNATLRADLANLLRAHQELTDSRDKFKQLQHEADRRTAQLEAGVSDLSQQLMLARSHNDRLNQRLSAAEAESAALAADLSTAQAAASSANRALQQAHMQYDLLEQQYKQQQREWQLQSQLQQQQQQVVEAAAAPAVPPAVTAFGIGSTGYQGLDLNMLTSNNRLGYGEQGVGAGLVGLASPGSPYHKYERQRDLTPLDGFSHSRPAGAAVSGSSFNAYAPARVVDNAPVVAVGSVVLQQQRARPVGGSQDKEAPWFAGGSRASPRLSPRLAAAQQHQHQQPDSQQQQVQLTGYAIGAEYLAAERSQQWQQQQQTTHDIAPSIAAPVITNSGISVRLAPVVMSEQQQSLQAAAGGAVLTPFGTEMTVAEIMARTKELEDLLLAYCQEKDDLNKEFSRMPLGAGKTLKERQRKQFVEQRLEVLDSSISKTRMQLKKILGR